MPTPEIAAWLDSYRGEFKDTLRFAARDGFQILAAGATDGVLSPRELSHTGRRHLSRHLRDLGLSFFALAADFPGHGLADPQHADSRFELVRDIAQLAADLGAKCVVVPVTGFGDEANAGLAAQVLAALAEFADRRGVTLAINPAGELEKASAAIRSLGCPSLKLAVDTADSPGVSDIEAVGGVLSCLFARDVRRRGASVEQVPYGQGDLDFHRLLAMLDQTGYVSPLVLRCDPAAGGAAMLRQGREYFHALLGRPAKSR